MNLTKEIVNELLRYNKKTGKLYWKHRDKKWFVENKGGNKAGYIQWNKQNAGKEAFTSIDSKGYLRGSIFKKLYRAHRIIWMMNFDGELPEEIDHKNGRRTDNRLSNLAASSAKLNRKNAKINSNNTTGHNGVSVTHNGKYRVRIKLDKKEMYFGTFDDIDVAIEVAKQKYKELGFSERHGK
jgi:hypothetical protein